MLLIFNAQSLDIAPDRWRLFFFRDLLPSVYPSPKQVKPKLKTAMRLSRVNIGIPLLKDFIQDDFYVIRGSQSLC